MTTKNSIDSDIPIPLAKGGSSSVSFTDGAVLLGSGSGAITALDVTAKGSLLVGDGTTDPVALSVGTNDHVLTADSAQASGLKWAAAAAGGGNGLVFISSATASGSASLTFTTGIDSTYNNYFFLFDAIVPATNNVRLYTRTSTDGGSTYSSTAGDYKQQATWSYSGLMDSSSVGQSYIRAAERIQGNVSTEQLDGQMILINPSGTELTTAYFNLGYSNSSGNLVYQQTSGVRKAAENVDAIQFIYGSGNVATGTISMYGMTTPS